LTQRSSALVPLLAACSVIGPIGNFMLLPALPAIARDFSVDVPATQLTVTMYLIAFALGVLLSGPLADRYGRKPLLLGGMAVAAVGAVLALIAQSLWWLVVARAVQGAGGAVGITVSRAAVGDLYRDNELSRKIAALTMTMVFGTAMSPYLGGLIAQSVGWRAGFWFLLGATVPIGFAVQRWFPETRHRGALDNSFARIWRESRAVVMRPVFLAYVIQAGLVYALFLVFISLAPYVMTASLGRSPSDFGLYYVFLSGGYFLGNWYVSRSSGAFTGSRLIVYGLGAQFLSAVIALAFALAGWVEPIYIFSAQFLLCIGQGLALPNIAARGVALAPGYAGVASSVMGFSQMAVAAVCVQLMGFAPTRTWLPVLTFCVAVAAIAWFTALALEHRTQRAAIRTA
jgi:DHA1 family bicyclomycin/chloramphenicol resistance-like MFS transporter